MTPQVKRKTLHAIWECLRTSAETISIENGCQNALLGRHLEYPERSPTIVTTIPVEFGHKPGWFSLWQEGGGLKVILWSPDARNPQSEARAAVDSLKRCLGSIMHLGEVQFRVKEPNEWLAYKGWPLKENGTCAKH